MSDKANDIILEEAWERVQDQRQEERLEQLLITNDLEGIYDRYADNG